MSIPLPPCAPDGKQLVRVGRVLPLNKELEKKVGATSKEDIDDIVEEVFPRFNKAVEIREY